MNSETTFTLVQLLLIALIVTVLALKSWRSTAPRLG